MTVKHHFLHYNIGLKGETQQRFGFLPASALKINLKRFLCTNT